MDKLVLKQEISGDYKYGFHDEEKPFYKSPKGLSEKLVREISRMKKEPEWMLDKRLEGLHYFYEKPMPSWGADLSSINFDEIYYYARPAEKQFKSWEDVPENMKKTFEKLGIPEAERKFLAGVASQYDCLTADTLIPTNPKGTIPISNIQAGDTVFALNEETNQIEKALVAGIAFKGERAVFEVNVAGRKIKATYNHPFLSLAYSRKQGKQRGRYCVEWKYLNQLKKGDLMAIVKDLPDYSKPFDLPKPELKQLVNWKNQVKGKEFEVDISQFYRKIQIPSSTNCDLMWFLGLYLGDGYINNLKSKKSKGVSIAIPESEVELRNELMRVVKNLFGYDVTHKEKYFIKIHSTILAKWLAQIGFGGKAYTKQIPEWVFSLPKDQKLAFIGGYLDSDGTVRNHKKNHDAVFTSVNKKILEAIKQLSEYVGLSSSNIWEIRQKYLHKNEEFTFYRMSISGNIKKIGARDPVRKSRMLKKKYFHSFSSARNTCFRKYTNGFIGFAKIEDIKYIGIEPVYDIEVEKHHNFVAQGVLVHNSEVVYHSLRENLEKKGVVFLDMDSGLREHEEIVRKYFGTIIPANDNKFAALNTAVWSGGSFLYVPRGVHVDVPLQAYFRINTKNMGQFERTLIIAEPGSSVHYLEGCSAPVYTTDALHSAVVEIIAMEGSRVQYTTIQNWSSDVYNLVTKRAKAYKDATVFWLDGNLGSKRTMKYPCVMLMEPGARGEVVSVALAGKGQHQDAGAKIMHLAPNTSSLITSKSISKDCGRTTYRGLVYVAPNASGVKTNVECDALILDEQSASDTVPYMRILNDDVSVSHEASVSKLDEEKLFYLQTRGFTEAKAKQMLVQGFIEPFIKHLPLEYAVELNRLVELEMEGSVG